MKLIGYLIMETTLTDYEGPFSDISRVWQEQAL